MITGRAGRKEGGKEEEAGKGKRKGKGVGVGQVRRSS
jgi:hypothetical protein